MTQAGALIGLPGFAAVILAAPTELPALFLAGNFLVGFGGALFGHGTLTATMNLAPREQAGLALGAWGAVQATGAGIGIALSGVLRDVVNALADPQHGPWGLAPAATGYLSVYAVEMVLLLVTLVAVAPLVRGARRASAAPAAPTAPA
jgi:BCD family chlorophyll transporter-like MFS transporter